ncbi:hypothetical protein ABK040_011645 [Willaertia magna]
MPKLIPRPPNNVRVESFFEVPIVKYKNKYYITLYDLRYFIQHEKNNYFKYISNSLKKNIKIEKDEQLFHKLTKLIKQFITKENNNKIIKEPQYYGLFNTKRIKGIVLLEYKEFEKYLKNKLREKELGISKDTQVSAKIERFRHVFNINIKWNVKRHFLIYDLDENKFVFNDKLNNNNNEMDEDEVDLYLTEEEDSDLEIINSINVVKNNVNNNVLSMTDNNNDKESSFINNTTITSSLNNVDINQFDNNNAQDIYINIMRQIENERKFYLQNVSLFNNDKFLHDYCFNRYLFNLNREIKNVEQLSNLNSQNKINIYNYIHNFTIEFKNIEKDRNNWKEDDLINLKEIQEICWKAIQQVDWSEEIERKVMKNNKTSSMNNSNDDNTVLLFGRLFKKTMEDLNNINKELVNH